MRPRWIEDDPAPKNGRIGTTVIARWWPGRYLLVSTIQLDGTSRLAQLTSSLETGLPFGKAPPLPERFVTQVFRCDKFGVARSFDHPLYEQEHATLSDAKVGHKDAVARFTR